ncbi:stalk domain-containing protein [Acetivibrio straminisolvens]|jgi:tetratricopeptide (TPR) repeat protein|nr:stalk domain-containing protein [Acetivibrio straminisolvens]
MKRKTLVLFSIAVILVTAFSEITNVKSFAESSDKTRKITLNLSDNGRISEVRQVIINNVVYIQLRPILEALGWIIEWNPVTKDIICKNGMRNLVFNSGNGTVFIDGEYVILDNPLVILDGAAYLPGSFIARQFGTQISWDGSSNLIITTGYDDEKISVKGEKNIVIAGNGIIVNIFEPYSFFTVYDMVSYADGLLARNRAESAVIKYKEILGNLSADDFPEIYVHVLSNLGNAYSLLAEKKDVKMNLLLAKDMYEKAYQFFKTRNIKENYGSFLLNFGNACRILYEISGDRGYLVRAVDLYNEAWDYCSSNGYSPDSGLIQYNLGLVYRELKMKNSAHSCLLQAADLFIKALDAYALEANPSFYAYIQYNLGNVYLLLSESEDTYIKKSKAAYEEALEVWIPEIHPLNYARVHRSMGDVYNKMYRMDENEDNLKFALAEYNEALKFFTIKTYPLDYAKTNTELGNTYLMLAQEEKDGKWTEDCERAYRQALEIFNSTDYPVYYKYLAGKLYETEDVEILY